MGGHEVRQAQLSTWMLPTRPLPRPSGRGPLSQAPRTCEAAAAPQASDGPDRASPPRLEMEGAVPADMLATLGRPGGPCQHQSQGGTQGRQLSPGFLSQVYPTLTPNPPLSHCPSPRQLLGPKAPTRDLVFWAPPACSEQTPPSGSAWRPCESCPQMDPAKPVTSSKASPRISWTQWGQLCEKPWLRRC